MKLSADKIPPQTDYKIIKPVQPIYKPLTPIHSNVKSKILTSVTKSIRKLDNLSTPSKVFNSPIVNISSTTKNPSIAKISESVKKATTFIKKTTPFNSTITDKTKSITESSPKKVIETKFNFTKPKHVNEVESSNDKYIFNSNKTNMLYKFTEPKSSTKLKPDGSIFNFTAPK